MASAYSAAACTILIAMLCIILAKQFRKFGPLHPPGPTPLPILGNALQLPREQPWAKFVEWGKQYGKVKRDIVFLCIFSRPMLVLNSLDAAIELQERRAAVYSDRPRRTMAELSGFDKAITLRQYGSSVRTAKKHMYTEFSKGMVLKYTDVQERAAEEFCELLSKSPGNFLEHIRRTTTSAILMVCYGRERSEGVDPFDELSREVLTQFTKMVSPSEYLVDSMPFLRYLPSWFPGAAFQRHASRNRQNIEKFMNIPYLEVKRQIADGVAVPSFVSNMLHRNDLTSDEEEIIKYSAGSLYGAGFETSVTSISTFFLAMVLHPDVQTRAQAEIDAVVGRGRLPSFEDRKNLPYVNCIVSEIIRWRPSIPFAWRCSHDEDVYRGYTIPRGTLVAVNVRALTHNPEYYPDPDVFRPERFLLAPHSDNIDIPPDPRRFVFGFGRRSCPGLHLADNFLYIIAVTTLASFRVSAELDAGNRPIIPDIKPPSILGGISPSPSFNCRIEPRA